MNLVAQEFIAAQLDADDPGVLVLSDQAGVHDLLGEATISVSPQLTEEFASGIETALSMSADERFDRMQALGREVVRHDVPGWIDDFLSRLATVRERDTGGEGRV
jgi:trehalose 6-phosphate synthase